MEKNKTGKYLKYAIGELLLVIIGILIALWINNLNQERIEVKESSNLKLALKEELLENKEEFRKYKSYVEQCHDKIIEVLNTSAGKNTEIPIDTLRKLVMEMLPTLAIEINESRLNSAKTTGQFRLLSSEEITALAAYETTIDNYKEARKLNNFFNTENRALFTYFSVVQAYHKRTYPDVVLANHPGYTLSDEDFLSFLKKKETYVQLNTILTSILVDINWLDGLDRDIDKTMAALN